MAKTINQQKKGKYEHTNDNLTIHAAVPRDGLAQGPLTGTNSKSHGPVERLVRTFDQRRQGQSRASAGGRGQNRLRKERTSRGRWPVRRIQRSDWRLLLP